LSAFIPSELSIPSGYKGINLVLDAILLRGSNDNISIYGGATPAKCEACPTAPDNIFNLEAGEKL
jgi:hypothetical protein